MDKFGRKKKLDGQNIFLFIFCPTLDGPNKFSFISLQYIQERGEQNIFFSSLSSSPLFSPFKLLYNLHSLLLYNKTTPQPLGQTTQSDSSKILLITYARVYLKL